MSHLSAKAGVFPAIPSQEKLDQTYAMRQRQNVRPSRFRMVFAGVLGMASEGGQVSFLATLQKSDETTAESVPDTAAEQTPEERLAGFESTLRDFESYGAAPAPLRFPYKG